MNELQPNEDVLEQYKQPHFNPNKVRVGVKLLIPLDYWSESVECECWIDELYYPSIKLITLDMALASVSLVGKAIVRFKKGMYDIALLSHFNDDKFNKMGLFDVRRFSVKKETYLITIYNNIHPCTDSIREDTSLDSNYQGVSYGLDDMIMTYYDFEDMKKKRLTI